MQFAWSKRIYFFSLLIFYNYSTIETSLFYYSKPWIVNSLKCVVVFRSVSFYHRQCNRHWYVFVLMKRGYTCISHIDVTTLSNSYCPKVIAESIHLPIVFYILRLTFLLVFLFQSFICDYCVKINFLLIANCELLLPMVIRAKLGRHPVLPIRSP